MGWTGQVLDRVLYKNAKQVVAFYKRRCWWVSSEDLHQEALMIQLDAAQRFNPAKVIDRHTSDEIDLERYLYAAATYGVRRLVLKASAPVSASHRLDVLKGLYRAGPLREDIADVAHNAERAYCARQVLDRLVRCLGEDGAQFALSMIVDEWNAQDVARANATSPTEVLREMMTLRGKLLSDSVLHQLWQEGI